MKILITTESYPPHISGVAVFANSLAKNMAARNHNVFVICPGKENKNIIETSENIIIYKLKSISNPLRKNHRFVLFPKKIVKKIIKEIKPDIIHLQDPAILALWVILEAKKRKIPVVITNHFMVDYINAYLRLPKFLEKHMTKIFIRYLRWFYGMAKIITCPTETVRHYLLNIGIKTKILPISNGIDIKQFQHAHISDELKQEFNIPFNKKIIAFVGRLDKDKQVDILIRAMPIVLEKLDAFFIICGDGKAKESLEQLVNNLKIKNYVKFLGAIDHKEIDKYYKMADVFVATSPIETQGIVIMEAMATGLPVIGSNSGAVPELIKNGTNGYLFEPGNLKDLAEKIILILTDSQKVQVMSEKSRELIQAHAIEKSMDKFEKVYLESIRTST